MLRRALITNYVQVTHSQKYLRHISRTSITLNDEKKTTEASESSENQDVNDESSSIAQELSPEDVLKKEIEELKAKNTDLSDKVLRALADAENVRRISRHDVQNAREFAISKFAKSLLDVSDNLKRAHESIVIEELHPDHTLAAIKSLHEGVVMTDRQLQKVFQEFHVTPVGAEGDPFDPNIHEALYEYEDPKKQAGSIGQLMKVGYKLNSRVLRPAQVGVVKASNTENNSNTQQ